jgi:ABC-type antimicrobial peptide transport system permease subunit
LPSHSAPAKSDCAFALGARRFNVIGLVLKEALLLAAIGLTIGLAGSVFVGRAMTSTLFGVAALDYSVILAVGLVLLGTALFASYWPAPRAALTDPVAALRTQ